MIPPALHNAQILKYDLWVYKLRLYVENWIKHRKRYIMFQNRSVVYHLIMKEQDFPFSFIRPMIEHMFELLEFGGTCNNNTCSTSKKSPETFRA